MTETKNQQNIYSKVLKWILYFMTALSILCIALALIEAFGFPKQFNYEGFRNFLNFFFYYKTIFAATIGILAIYVAIEKMELAKRQQDLNEFSIRLSLKSLKDNGKNQFQKYVSEYLEKNNYIKQNLAIYEYINKNLFQIYYYFFDIDFSFEHEIDLERFITRFFKNEIYNFEINDKANVTDNYYDTVKSLKSFKTFWNMIVFLTNTLSFGFDLEQKKDDIRTLYLDMLNELTNIVISENKLKIQRHLKS
jgi:hypothetical protein